MNPLSSSPGKSSQYVRNVPTNVSVSHWSLVIRHSQRGVALVIILAFIVLLTGVVVAFFSRAISERQVSNSSASQTRSEIFAQGAVDQIIGDLKQEIADPANSTVTSLATGVNLYAPKAPINAVPALAGSSGKDGFENLVKRSASGVAFYTGGKSRAASASTATASQNGRLVSPARWNKPLFLPATSGTDLTPKPVAGAFTAPDWILVGRDGTNPPTVTPASTSANYVVGRYAYNIYDEGGLLDANVAGSPLDKTTGKLLGAIAPYKSTLSYADLTQLPGISAIADPAERSKVINALVGWRNYSSGGPTTGTFPAYTSATPVPPALLSAFDLSTLGNNKGYITTSNTSLASGQSDRLFSSRHELIQLLSSIGNTATALTPALQQQTLQYLTTFSRDLNQPSLTPDSTRPKVVAGPGGNLAFGNDDLINPSFIKTRVTTPFTRLDGSSAQAGDLLVNERFALNRLAWLTFKGPIAADNGVLSTDGDLANIIADLKRRGLTEEFLKRGGPANIRRYFGLRWDPASKLWRYNVHNGNETEGANATGPITRLATVGTLNREPDFVELLKATITVGSKAKGANDDGTPTNPSAYQYSRDKSPDFALLHIAANIIDQFDLDGFPTRIRFNDGAVAEQEFRGVENLPYFYQTRVGGVEARLPNPAAATMPLIDTGVGVAFQQPIIWNPHDQDSTRCALDTSGNPLTRTGGQPLFPTSFRLVADSIDPEHIGNSYDLRVQANNDPASKDAGPETPASSAPFLGDFSVQPVQWTAANTAFEFDIPNSATGSGFYREPTLLIRPNIPVGSNLRAASGNWLRKSGYKFLVGVSDPTDGSVLNVEDGKRYFGFYMATLPVRYVVTNQSTKVPTLYTWSSIDCIRYGREPRQITYRVQSEDPTAPGTYLTYDEKYAFSLDNESVSINSTTGKLTNGLIGDDRWATSYDPRTSRFGFPQTNADFGGGAQDQRRPAPVANANNYGWLSQEGNVLVSIRPDGSAGWGGYDPNGTLPKVGGWSPGSSPPINENTLLRYGLISQNNPGFANNGIRWKGDPVAGSATGPQFYSDPDGVVRKASGAYATSSGLEGLPMATATSYNALGAPTRQNQAQSRPIVLNRPFTSVSELGYVFSDTPWKNLDFFTPESGDAGALDVFSINEVQGQNGLVAGKVNLNTRQFQVLQAILTGAYKDEFSSANLLTGIPTGEAGALAGKLVARTTGATVNGQTPTAAGDARPITNTSELVGKFISGTDYNGFTADVSAGFSAASDQRIQRLREAAIRALAASGQTRIWNLMIDVVAQTGRYPQGAVSSANFVVEGEQRYWVHVALDRLTGKVIDTQFEVVKE